MKPARMERMAGFSVLGCPQFANPRDVCPGTAWERLKALKAARPVVTELDYEVGLEVYPPGFPDNGFQFYYMAGVPLPALPAELPEGYFACSVPENEYAVFDVPDLEVIAEVFRVAYREWLPASGYVGAGSYDFEKYRFEPRRTVEIYIPVRNADC